MDNPCLKCKLTPNEKAACTGCPERLEWERLKIINFAADGADQPALMPAT